eukprot:3313337-Lingulodinium_polyedra.AAC.1
MRPQEGKHGLGEVGRDLRATGDAWQQLPPPGQPELKPDHGAARQSGSHRLLHDGLAHLIEQRLQFVKRGGHARRSNVIHSRSAPRHGQRFLACRHAAERQSSDNGARGQTAALALAQMATDVISGKG